MSHDVTVLVLGRSERAVIADSQLAGGLAMHSGNKTLACRGATAPEIPLLRTGFSFEDKESHDGR
ncbi:hypothetical protein ACRE_018480 [Hapsidospora chrysogenum ATCC 11550]|uniref:Uncharacterized protein n=1 Tax=Hapsidospora chrysogenum (strain ATCC 11550 / CBS 779.69 / DSM 880 / IAM 14645 / JCM 23072 / IMI 49137) TaxID=857340 RepID=A0A086TD08_HAPC1|nr:hypothetical protein ACRE_018480 [Hapsidospora chrysogenum ATCC 11550]